MLLMQGPSNTPLQSHGCTRPSSKSSTLRPRYSTSDRLALALALAHSPLSNRELSPWHVTAHRHVLTHTPFNSFDHVICLLVRLLLISSSVVECEELVPAMLRLMETRNEDARFQGCAECLVWLPCFVVVQALLPCLAAFSRCRVKTSFS